MVTMFKCKACDSTEFKLVVHPDFEGSVEITTNEHNEVIVQAGQQRFTADLMFINQFGVCSRCGATKEWDYFFVDKQEAQAG